MCDDLVVRVMDVSTGRIVRRLAGHTDRITDLVRRLDTACVVRVTPYLSPFPPSLLLFFPLLPVPTVQLKIPKYCNGYNGFFGGVLCGAGFSTSMWQRCDDGVVMVW